MKRIIVFYHENCRDGFSAAWAAWKKLGNTADYIAVAPDPHDESLGNISGKSLYFLDAGPNQKERIERLKRKGNRVILIDHHRSRETTLRFYHETFFDLKNSGAVLAWKYFHPKKSVPTLLRYVEGYDLWQFTLPYSQELTAALEVEDFSFSRWDVLAREFESRSARKRHIDAGKGILKYIETRAEKLAKDAHPAIFEGKRALVLNSSLLRNEISHYALTRLKTHLMITWRRIADEIHVSLRSDKYVDAAAIARKYGGGGHPRAAAFALSAKKGFPWKPIK